MLQDSVEQWFHVAVADGVFQTGIAFETRCVNDREIQLLVGCAEFVEQFKSRVHSLLRVCVFAVDLVDDNDRLQAQSQCLTRHETRLRHRAFLCIDQQQNTVNHRQYALYLATEVGMARGIDDVDVRAFVFDCAVLRQNRDTTFFFDIVRIHHACIDVLVVTESTGLTQQLVNQCGLAVVNVGNDGNVADSARCV